MSSPDWSDEQISRANRFAVYVVVSWVVLVVLSALFAGAGLFGFLLVGVVTLWVTWLLVHSLFSQVDELVKTRLEEAGATETGRADATDTDEAETESADTDEAETNSTDAADTDADSTESGGPGSD